MRTSETRTLALTAYRLGKLEEAQDAAHRVLQQNEFDGRMWELLGAIHFDRKRMNQCADALERAALCIPLTTENRIRLARAYGAMGSRELSRDLLLEIEQSTDLTVALGMQVAAGFDAIDLPQMALKLCRKLTREDSDHAALYYEMGFYAVRSGYPATVVIALGRRAIDLAPDNISYRIGLSLYLKKHGRLAEAIAEVAGIEQESLESLSCKCCLQRIAGIFAAAGDLARAACCRERLAQLASEQ